MANLQVKIERTNQKVHFNGVSESNQDISIPFDFAPPIGDGKGFAGLELLLMSFVGCVSTAIVFLIGRLGKSVSSYTAEAEGIRTEQPLGLKEISMKIHIKSDDITETDMENAIKQAETISPVWQAVKNNITVHIYFDLL
ncbi:MAG: OsmC family protein [Bacillota bacterium]|nr:OsmC family protein [Bacillota bacterium]